GKLSPGTSSLKEGPSMGRCGYLALLAVLAGGATAAAQTTNRPTASGGPRAVLGPPVEVSPTAVLGAPVEESPTVSPPRVQGGVAACAQERCVGWEGSDAP